MDEKSKTHPYENSALPIAIHAAKTTSISKTENALRTLSHLPE
jgi:hypothetical protein